MPLTDDYKGINADGSRNDDYCNYCYVDGRFRQDLTMEQMVEHCARFTDDINKWSGENMTVEIIKKGQEENQGLAYLDDGTMIVIDQGLDHIGHQVEVTVSSVLQTNAGKMIFADYRKRIK